MLIVWTGSEAEFKHFIKFCNDYASGESYKLIIKFTSSRPSKAAAFLDNKIEVQSNRTLSTDLFCKSTASFQYLQCNSYHQAHVTTSLAKSQFMRIRWLCSYILGYSMSSDASLDMTHLRI